MRMMEKIMTEFFSGMDPQDLVSIMERMMPKIMDSCFSVLAPDQMIKTIHEVVPKMMELCLSKMDAGKRESMMEMCREILESMHQRYAK